MDRWSKFWRLSWQERRLVMQALVVLPLAGVALRWLGLRRCQSVLAQLSSLEGTSSKGREEILRQARMTAHLVQAAAGHGPYRGTCLVQSLALWWLLRRQGIQSELRFGVRKEGNQVEAHAWVELLGLSLTDPGGIDERFTALDRAILPVGTRFP